MSFNQLDLEAVPGMPRVEDFPRYADMGLVLFSCIIIAGRTAV
jgi:hypothetical protein